MDFNSDNSNVPSLISQKKKKKANKGYSCHFLYSKRVLATFMIYILCASIIDHRRKQLIKNVLFTCLIVCLSWSSSSLLLIITMISHRSMIRDVIMSTAHATCALRFLVCVRAPNRRIRLNTLILPIKLVLALRWLSQREVNSFRLFRLDRPVPSTISHIQTLLVLWYDTIRHDTARYNFKFLFPFVLSRYRFF